MDFTLASGFYAGCAHSRKHKVNLVIGTTGFTAENMAEIDQLAKSIKVGIILASNFALGAVLDDVFRQTGRQIYGLCRNN